MTQDTSTDTFAATQIDAREDSEFSPTPATQAPLWARTHTPSWSLGPQHGKYLHKAYKFLLGVPGGPEWESLLANFVTFESLSSSHVSTLLLDGSMPSLITQQRIKCKLPVRPRPREVSHWFKQGRPLEFPNQLPTFKSLESFEKEWVAWWSAAQPEWRNTEDWPLHREDVDDPDWDELPNGGKDGLFLIVVTLGWWILVRDPSKNSKLDDAIADVAWVVDKLITLLSAEASVSDSEGTSVPKSNSESDSDSGLALAPPPKQRSKAVKKGPPAKRAPPPKTMLPMKIGLPVKIGPLRNAKHTRS